MVDAQTRINAMISYLFLGPFFLLAKSGTPLAHPFVRAHAKKGSLFLFFGAIGYMILFFSKTLLSVSFFGVQMYVALLSFFFGILLLTLLVGAYKAYHGIEAKDLRITSFENMSKVSLREGDYSEEDKIRIIASFIPFIGIFTHEQYPSPETQTGRKLGNFLTFLFLIFVGFAGKADSVVLLVTIIYIALIVITGVYLFLNGNFLSLKIYDFIPTYRELEANIKTFFFLSFDFMRVTFGGAKKHTFSSTKQKFLDNTHSFAGKKAQLLSLFLLAGVGVWYFGLQNPLLLILLFPLLTLIAERKNDDIRAPIVSIGADIASLFSHTKKHIETLEQTTVEEKFTYEEQK